MRSNLRLQSSRSGGAFATRALGIMANLDFYSAGAISGTIPGVNIDSVYAYSVGKRWLKRRRIISIRFWQL